MEVEFILLFRTKKKDQFRPRGLAVTASSLALSMSIRRVVSRGLTSNFPGGGNAIDDGALGVFFGGGGGGGVFHEITRRGLRDERA